MKKATRNVAWATAMVTGASAGIGEEIARQLASAGTNLILVARDGERLARQARAYTERYGIDVETLAADLSDYSQLLHVEERARSAGNRVDLLVNNAAFGTNGVFHELPVENEQREIELNVIALMRLTHAALGQMAPRRRGAILNISSFSALLPGPRMATYAATKAYVTSFTESIHQELRGSGISVTAMHPGFTRTEFQQRAGMQTMVDGVPSLLWMSAEQVARYSLLAAQQGKVFAAPGWYRTVTRVLEALPRGAKRLLSSQMKQ